MAKTDEDKLQTPDPELLPNREAMSIIDPLPGGLHDLELPSTAPPPGAETTQGSVGGATDAAASGSGSETVTDEDRHEQISQSDSAVSET
jgi:hypothetical protein